MKYQGAFSRIVGFAGKRFLLHCIFSSPPSNFFCFCGQLSRNKSIWNAYYAGYSYNLFSRLEKIGVDHSWTQKANHLSVNCLRCQRAFSFACVLSSCEPRPTEMIILPYRSDIKREIWSSHVWFGRWVVWIWKTACTARKFQAIPLGG